MATQPLPFDERPARRHSIVWPTILIGFGLLFLAQNMGLVGGNVWWGLWQLWPLLLVAVGIDLIFNRSLWGGLIGALLVLAVGAALVLGLRFTAEAPYYNLRVFDRSASASVVTERIVEELGPTRQATVTLNHGFGSLQLGATAANSGLLVDAALPRPEHGQVVRSVDRQGERATVTFRDRWNGSTPAVLDGDEYNWNVQLSPLVATDLRVDSGASSVNLDLRDLNVRSATLNTGAGSTTVFAPRAGQSSLNIKAGAAAIDVTVPEGTAARVTVKNGIGSTSVDQRRFPTVGSSNNTYQSPNYATAANRVDITIESGVSSVTVR
ncbi:MAG: LiaI-LiaF-like domain-containing protein [Chloroflexota bacterium]